MSAVFGIDAQDMMVSADHRTVYMNRFAADGTDALHALQQLHADDMVFIKHYTPEEGLYVSAIGVVQPRHPECGPGKVCLPVQWVWSGNRHIENPEEENSRRSKALYEEYDIEVQRELDDMMPEEFRLAPVW